MYSEGVYGGLKRVKLQLFETVTFGFFGKGCAGMSLAGIGLDILNAHIDFKAIELRYRHKLLRGNFAILPSRHGTHIFALLGKANGIKKIMTTQALFGLHYIDYENHEVKFDPAVHAENSSEWFQNQAKLNGFKAVKQFISW